MAIEYQKSSPGSPEIDKCIVNAAYNHHIHTQSSCFGKRRRENSNSKNGNLGHYKNCECRYKSPQRKKRKTIIQNAGNAVSWYFWNGTFKEWNIQ